MSSESQTYQFQAETRQLLDLVIHSLYTNKDIFLRELLSNASDALDRLRFEALTRPELATDGDAPEIHISTDPAARTLTVRDNGIGMSRDEVVANIGTIAKSGTRELRERIKSGDAAGSAADLIGQFGVGFYSAFMVADRVTLETRRAGDERGTRWESSGEGEFTIADADLARNGTAITLHLKPVDAETGIADYTDHGVLSRVVKQHSDFVTYPVILDESPSGNDTSSQRNVLNSMRPLWTRPQSEVTEEEYAEFYKHISHDWVDPLKTIFVNAEGRLEYRALLFLPAKAPFDLFYESADAGLRLYAKGVLIMEKSPDLLPRYLRFVRGVVDSADLPLNVSRQMLQQDAHAAQIRKGLTKKVLDALQALANSDPEKYRTFWGQFGAVLKEGAASDFESKDKILPLLLFQSLNDPSALTTLDEYVGRMKEDQSDIFYLTGESRAVVENSPHLEAFKERGVEVLYLVDPVDEFVAQSFGEFRGKHLRSAAKGDVQLGSADEREKAEAELKEKEADFEPLLAAIKTALEKSVREVRLSSRLTASPACLVGSEHDLSPHLERMLQRAGADAPKRLRVLELNPDHDLVKKLKSRVDAGADAASLSDFAELLFGYATIAEGSEIEDPVRFNRLVVEMMTRSL